MYISKADRMRIKQAKLTIPFDIKKNKNVSLISTSSQSSATSTIVTSKATGIHLSNATLKKVIGTAKSVSVY